MITHATSVGRRAYNEDTFTIGSIPSSGWYHSYIGVFDGHGGDEVSLMCRDKLHSSLIESQYDLRATFGKLNQYTETMSQTCGSTGVVALIGRSSIRVGNVGDSSALIVKSDGSVTRLTKMHLASDGDEAENVRVLGGVVVDVSGVMRVGGNLMVTRSIGDNYLTGVNRVPEITQHSVTSSDKYLVVVTDGITDVLPDELIGKYVTDTQADPGEIVRVAIDRGSRDNCTIVIADII